MSGQNRTDHFKGKSVAEHLKEARLRGARAESETHGTELPGHLSAFFVSAKDGSISLALLWAAFKGLAFPLAHFIPLFITFGCGWLIWKAGRSALMSWARLERLHRVIEEERWEIEHHREQEKEELRELYEAKGFSGKLLNDVISVLISDDNRLLKVMLEEELGLTLEVHEHPLKEAAGSASGTLLAALLTLPAAHFWPLFGLPVIGVIVILISSGLIARYEKRSCLASMVWNGSLALFTGLFVYFISKGISIGMG